MDTMRSSIYSQASESVRRRMVLRTKAGLCVDMTQDQQPLYRRRVKIDPCHDVNRNGLAASGYKQGRL
jgi:hypothetical protein